MKDFWSKELPSFSTVTDENTKIQLSLNAESYSRLCFFSVPLKYISIYKKYIFPIVQNYNFVPITVDEFIQSGDNLLATISSLIDKASIVVVDISSNTTRNELGMILNSKKSKENIIIITDNNDILPSDLYNITTLNRPENFLEDVDDFVYAFEKYFNAVAGNTQERINGEARRLLEKHEYAAAVISAVTLFEDVLRNELDKKIDKSSNVYSLTQLLRLANERQLISQNQVGELREWIMIRNKFVHTTDRQMNRHLATRIITSIEQAIQHIRNQ
jgi:hypothetical protein